MNKKILISTGGSGGHVVPATVFFEHLKDNFEVYMSSDLRGVQFMDKEKYNLEIINMPKLSKNLLILPFQIFLILLLIVKSFLFLKRKKIDILISTGGYMSLPLCIASKFLNIRILLYEPNMILGRMNKLFLNICEKIFCYSDKIKDFPKKLINKITIIKPLLRRDFYLIKTGENINKEINLLIIGGSQSAEIFDNSINDSILKISKKYEITIFHQTNSKNFKDMEKFYSKNNIKNELFDFSESVLKFMKKTNICISRAGASTLAELTFLNIPHIAVPFPFAKDNHQFENAQFYQIQGCNWILNQNELTENSLTNRLFNIIENKNDYLKKKENMRNFSYQNTWSNINQKITNIINEN